jgi:hypothetical protein
MEKATEAKQGSQIQKAAPTPETSLYEDMDRMFDNFFGRRWMRPWRGGWPALREVSRELESRFPRVDVIDRDSEILVKAELPGVEKKDLDISMTEDSVTIKGSTRHGGHRQGQGRLQGRCTGIGDPQGGGQQTSHHLCRIGDATSSWINNRRYKPWANTAPRQSAWHRKKRPIPHL